MVLKTFVTSKIYKSASHMSTLSYKRHPWQLIWY